MTGWNPIRCHQDNGTKKLPKLQTQNFERDDNWQKSSIKSIYSQVIHQYKLLLSYSKLMLFLLFKILNKVEVEQNILLMLALSTSQSINRIMYVHLLSHFRVYTIFNSNTLWDKSYMGYPFFSELQEHSKDTSLLSFCLV